jgi:DNA-binding IclR family transcriptional regulator
VELTASRPARQGPTSPASQTLGRGLDVLEEVAAGPVALAVIASRLGLSRSTVHRLATSLIERRYLTLAPRRGYSLGPKLLELGSRARGQISLVRAARPFMEMLAAQTGDAVLLAVRDGDAAMLADCVAGSRRVAPRLWVGERQDLLRSAAGRALLLDTHATELAALCARAAGDAPLDGNCAAFVGSLGAEAAQGWTLDQGEAAEIVTIAAPVRGADGSIRAALGLAFAATYQGLGLAAPARESLRRCAEAVSQELGWRITNRQGDEDFVTAGRSAERELLSRRMAGDELPDASGSGTVAGRAERRGARVRRMAAATGALMEDGMGGPELEDQGTKGRGA